MKKTNILIIEDDPDGRRSLQDVIEDMGCCVEAAGGGEEGLRQFEAGQFDAVVTDLVMPDIDGMEVLARIREADSRIPVIIITAYGTVSSAVDALKNGAYDYITKPLDLDDMQLKMHRAIETGQLRTEVRQLKETVHARHGLKAMIGKAPPMQVLVEQVRSLADTAATVLIQGESGSGKEVIARALHAESIGRSGAFVAVNCGGFAESLLESELFGHEKGAFTGATERRMGAFERADGGTIFLDEVGTAPASVQVKLLRVLEERELLRVGGQETISVDVRLVSASNRNLEDLVEEGAFREDLMYRLQVVTLDMPPLRERREDIRLLVDHFVAQTCEQHGRNIRSVDADVYELLETHEWPGNVRQLRNVIESAVVLTAGTTLSVADIHLREAPARPESDFAVPEGWTMAEIEKEVLVQVLKRYDGNRTLAAEKLGISRRTIQRKIQDFGLPF